ncbi:MAG: DinB family protein [Candidatus Eiseniibacteriota bacterium]
MSADKLLFLFDFNERALTRNCGGITHEESLVPPPAGNSINWVLGHILANRSAVLGMLGETPLWGQADADVYEHGEDKFDVTKARRFESLLEDFKATQERIRSGIARLTPASMEEFHSTEDKRNRGDRLFFMQFHEAYHIGQIGLLRRLAGKPGAI